MTKKHVLLGCFLIASLLSRSQLKWLNPTPSGFYNSKLHFINKDTGYLFNLNGDMFRTNDKGDSWKMVRNFPLSTTFKINDSTGVVPSLDGTIQISSDNGETWTKKSINQGPLSAWVDIIGRDTIYLIRSVNPPGTGKHLIRSVDRGNTWTVLNTLFSNVFIETIDFIDSKTAYAGNTNGIINNMIKTVDSGKTWTTIWSTNSTAYVTHIKFFSKDYGLAYRGTGIMKTLDGGTNWTTVPQSLDKINDFFFADSLNVYASGQDGAVYKSIDAGSSWTYVSSSARIFDHDISSQFFFDANTGIITGQRGRLLKTTNGGTSWVDHSPTYNDITSISFGDNNTGYATTWNSVYKTTDGGVNWTPLVLSGLEFNQSHFRSKDTGFIMSSDPAILHHTTDGGLSWTRVNPVTPPYGHVRASGLSFLTEDTAFIALRSDNSNAFYKTNDAGKTWQPVSQNQNLFKVQFFSQSYGYANGYSSLMKTDDGGVTWKDLPIPSTNGVNSFWFVNPAKGFIIYNSAYMQMTLDSGKTWNYIKPPVNYYPDYVTIKFLNENVGYVSDDDGAVYKTIDGGFHWRLDANTGNRQTNTILFRGDSTVIFAGEYGAIATKSIQEYAVDSVSVFASLCGGTLTAIISSAFTKIDSIYFEYGQGTIDKKVAAAPFTIDNDSKKIKATISGLPGAAYAVRLRALIDGQYKYFGDQIIRPNKPPTPTITVNGNVLQSSAASGNQWFLNGDTIPGATAQQYTVSATGAYTVTKTDSACKSNPSIAYNHTATAITEVDLQTGKIEIYPNPVTDGSLKIKIDSYTPVILKVIDTRGHAVISRSLKNGMNIIPVTGFTSGIYILNFTDSRTHKSANKKIFISNN